MARTVLATSTSCIAAIEEVLGASRAHQGGKDLPGPGQAATYAGAAID